MTYVKRTRKYEPEPVEEEAEKPRFTGRLAGYTPGIMRHKEAPPLDIMVAMPTRDMINAEFMYDFAQLTAVVCSTLVADNVVNWSINMLQGTAIHSLRQEFAEMALEKGASHILWLDTDHRFPADSFFRLLDRGLPMVGVNYSTRKFPPSQVAFKKIATTPGESNVKLYTTPESSGIECVDALGFGMVLMDTKILKTLDPAERWFQFVYDKQSRRDVGEDVYFCRLVREAGWEIHVDHDLSKEIGHLGTFDYRVDHANMMLGEELEDGSKQLLDPADSDLDVAGA